MRSTVVTLLLLLVAMPLACAEDSCGSPDVNFETFLVRFKNDKAFQQSRIIYPLEMSSTEPGDHGQTVTTNSKFSLKEIQSRPMTIIRGRAEAASLENGEGKLCEQDPEVKGDQATFVQYSCNTDVYGDTYHFVLKNRCWFLQRVETSGG